MLLILCKLLLFLLFLFVFLFFDFLLIQFFYYLLIFYKLYCLCQISKSLLFVYLLYRIFVTTMNPIAITIFVLFSEFLLYQFLILSWINLPIQLLCFLFLWFLSSLNSTPYLYNSIVKINNESFLFFVY
jgi:hypothetical protein